MNNEQMQVPMNMEGMNQNMNMNPNMNPMMISQMNQMMMSQMMGANGKECSTFIDILSKTGILVKAMALYSFLPKV